VARRHLVQALVSGEQLEGLLCAAVDRVHELQITDAEVVLGVHLDEHLFDR
jgi:hypothetical protein